MTSKKSVTKEGLLAFLEEGQFEFPPLQVERVQTEASFTADNRVIGLDALLTLRWRNRSYRFGVETRRLWTPKSVAEAVDTVRRHVSFGEKGLPAETVSERLYPLVLIPYLSEERLLALQNQGVSGIDLCGNGVVLVPDELLVLRTGFPNQFRWEGTIKNVYRKNSSIVARVFLLVPEFNSVTEALAETRNRGGTVTLATVSKVCKGLEDDLILERSRPTPPAKRPAASRQLRLLQAEKLLDLLADNYTPPAVSRTFRGKCGLRPEELRQRFAEGEQKSDVRLVLTGASSAEAYAVMAREPMQSFYCSNLNSAVRSLGDDIRETDRFAKVALLETRDDFVYFDRRAGLVASPIQSYLELLGGDKRERETATQVRRVILESLSQAGRKGG